MQVRGLFELYDKDADHTLSIEEISKLLQDISNKITALPAVRPSPPYSVPALMLFADGPGSIPAGQIPWPQAL